MITIPKGTQVAIDDAFQEMKSNSEQYISYYFRWRIYENIIQAENLDGLLVFGRLGLASARFVLPIWVKAYPGNKMPNELVNMLERYLEMPSSYIRLARESANTFWDYVEKLGLEVGNKLESLSVESAFYAAQAIAEAAMEILGKIPYKGIATIERSDSDRTLDAWVGDTAFWAANAFAGRYGTSRADYEKFGVFWTWWLKDAIPHSIMKNSS